MTNEILKDEILKNAELEQVAGGNRNELALDTMLWDAMGHRTNPVGVDDITDTNVNQIASKVSALYSKAGIQVQYNDFGGSNYFIDGVSVTRNRAIKIVIHKLGYDGIIDPKHFQI